MGNLTLVGTDAGNKNLKILVDGDKEPVIIPNVVGDVRDFKGLVGIFDKKNKNPINCLDVSIKSNGKELGRKYVGNLAIQKGSTERPLNKEKYNDDDILFATLTGIAYALYDSVNPIKTVNLALGTCLPTKEYLDKQKIDIHEKRFIGTHEVKFHDKVFNGASISIKIYDGNIITSPEGTIALFNIMADEKGDILSDYENSEDELYIIVDIGGGTTDISATMNLEQIPELVDSMEQGILYAEQMIIQHIRLEGSDKGRDFTISAPELDYNIRKKNYKLAFNKEIIDIKKHVDMEFSRLWADLSKILNNKIQLMPPNLKRHIAGIVLTGGSSILLEKYINKTIGEYDLTLSKTPLKDNVEGCLKAIKVSVRMKEVATGEDEIYEQK